jgi:hypothetical protein
MDHAFIVRKLERLANLRYDFECFAGGKFARPLQLPQVQSVHKFHDEEWQAVHLSELIDGDDVRMV